MADVGGYLGLLLGYSGLTGARAAARGMRRAAQWWWGKAGAKGGRARMSS